MPLIRQTIEYAEWFERLRDRQARVRVDVRVRRLGMGNPGQHRVLSGECGGTEDRLRSGVSRVLHAEGLGVDIAFDRWRQIVAARGHQHRSAAREGTGVTMAIRTLPWDAAEHLRSDEDRVAYLNAALDEAGDDP